MPLGIDSNFIAGESWDQVTEKGSRPRFIYKTTTIPAYNSKHATRHHNTHSRPDTRVIRNNYL
jgi:hypothetical protein